jgi:hypothetical protein
MRFGERMARKITDLDNRLHLRHGVLFRVYTADLVKKPQNNMTLTLSVRPIPVR